MKLTRDESHGYLRSLLQELDVPLESQLLVYSKSSAQIRLITPRTPRAIYFNDDVYVAWIPDTEFLEISAVDPHKGGLFYRLGQAAEVPRLERDQSCLLCHISSTTLRVPGHVVRSFTTDEQGQMRQGWPRITHETPLRQRWGGWYVSGETGSQFHLGNLVGDEQERIRKEQYSFRSNLLKLPFIVNLDRYPLPHSDAVAHLVLEHQAHGHNLITRLNYEARLKQPLSALEPLVRYLTFADEARLLEPVTGSTAYRQQFEQRGPRDAAGRSLRDFDLQTRMFRYRLSYLIYSRSFQALPEDIRQRVQRRIVAILDGSDPDLQHHTAEERTALREILQSTAPEFLAVE